MRGIGCLFVRLAPPVTGRGHAHEARVEAVLHVALEDAVLDEDGARCRCAFVVDGERAAAVGKRAVIDDGDAGRGDALAEKTGKGGGLLAVEIALEAVADRFVQKNTGPAGPEHHVHLAGRGGHRFEIDQCLTQRLVDLGLPVRGVDIEVVAGAAADAEGTALLPVAVARDNGDVETDERADVAERGTVGADDLDRLPLACERGGDLLYAGILRTRIGVDLGKKLHLLLEGLAPKRVLVGIEMRVGARRAFGGDAGVTRLHRLHGVARALQRRFGKFRGMGIAGRFARDAAQAEALIGVEARGLEAAVIEAEHFRLAVLHEEFAVIRALERVADKGGNAVAVEPGAGEEKVVGRGGHDRHIPERDVIARTRPRRLPDVLPSRSPSHRGRVEKNYRSRYRASHSSTGTSRRGRLERSQGTTCGEQL